jgi:hypothetical protein
MSILAEWQRRRAASNRLPRYSDTCACRDHWTHRCYGTPPNEHQLDAAAAAAEHILEQTGCTPLLRPEYLRGLRRRPGRDRALAERLHRLTEGAIA